MDSIHSSKLQSVSNVVFTVFTVCMVFNPSENSLLQLVSLQKASGCWKPDAALAAALGKTREEVESTKPASVG